MTDARTDRLPHVHEIVLLLNLLLIYALTVQNTNAVLETLPMMLIAGGGSMLIEGLIAVAIRLLIAYVRGTARQYLAIIKQPAWILESFRLLISATLLLHVYSWIKVVVPLLHPQLFDRQLWDIDRIIFFGISPNIFFLNLFSNHQLLRVIDVLYGNIFLAGLTIAIGFFLSEPSKRLRLAFIAGHVYLWLTGSWLYMLIPSLGPAYRFPDVWLQFAADLRTTQHLQALLWENYATVMALRHGNGTFKPINIVLGIGAFPSLHVAFQTFIFLWFRRLWKGGEVLFGIFVFVISLGALVTGWHYLIDVLAGFLLAWIVWAATSRRYGIVRFANLRAAL